MIARTWCLIFAVLLTGVSSGFFFTYSASVTPGLAILDDLQYVTTFQALNEAIRNAAFGTVYFGSLLLIILSVCLHIRIQGPARWLILASLACYVLLVGVTVSVNIPLNQQLEVVSPESIASAARSRLMFERTWNIFNDIRTLVAIGAFLLLILALALSPAVDEKL